MVMATARGIRAAAMGVSNVEFMMGVDVTYHICENVCIKRYSQKCFAAAGPQNPRSPDAHARLSSRPFTESPEPLSGHSSTRKPA